MGGMPTVIPECAKIDPGARRVLCLVNPRSGANRGVVLAEQLASLIQSEKLAGGQVLLLDGRDIPSRQFVEEVFTDVVVAGGDGTFSSVLPRFVGSSVCFHLVAMGTGNDLPRELGVKVFWKGDAEEFLKRSFALPVTELRVWGVEFRTLDGAVVRRSLLNYISLGWDGIVVDELDKLRRSGAFLAGKYGSWGNRILYALVGLRHRIYRLPALRISTETAVLDLPVGLRSVLFSNIRSFMGVGRANSVSDYSDALIEMRPLRTLFDYPRMLLPECVLPCWMKEDVTQASSFEIEISADDRSVPLEIDGEFVPIFEMERIRLSPRGTVRLAFDGRRA